MSKHYDRMLTVSPGDPARTALRMGAVGGALAAAMAAGENAARCRANLVDREKAIASTLRAAARGALAGACGGAASATLGGPTAARIATFLTVAATTAYLMESRPAAPVVPVAPTEAQPE